MNPTETAVLDPIDDARTAEPVLCTADLAECACPDFCERDHEND
jgi:hypothetical protein